MVRSNRGGESKFTKIRELQSVVSEDVCD